VRPFVAGFSIPELLVVLFLVGVLALMIVPNLEIVKFKMDGAARGVVAALVSAQRQAVVRQHDVIVAIDTANRRLRIHQDRDNDGQRDAQEPIRQVPFDDGVVFGLGGAPALFESATVGFTDTQDGMPVVRFLRTGSAGEEGYLYLTSSRTVDTGDYPKDTRAVKVDRATGRVTWYYYDPDQWQEGF
jgi:prepilin-type N-terminal cleavage/methylation domain-containing protein